MDIHPYDIHRLDQALPEALADVDQLATNPLLRQDIHTKGIALAAAQWTADLADRHTHMGLAGAYVLATIRRIQAQEQQGRVAARQALLDYRDANHRHNAKAPGWCICGDEWDDDDPCEEYQGLTEAAESAN